MGEHIETTGIKPGQITGGEVKVEAGVEALCLVVDHEIVPAIRKMCSTQKENKTQIQKLKDVDNEQKAQLAILEERSGWTKAFIILGIGSVITAVFTLIVAIIIPAFVGG